MTKLTYFPLDDDLVEPLDDGDINLTGEVADYEGFHIKTTEMGETARSAVPPAGGKIQIDFKAAVAPRFFALLNHNIYAGNPTIISYDDNFITPSGETRIITQRDLDMKSYGAPMAAKRYWEIDVNGCSFNDSFFEVGKVCVGLAVRTFLNDYSGFKSGADYRNLYNETAGGVCYAHKLEARRSRVTLLWEASLAQVAIPDILEMLDLTRGGAHPLILIPDNDEAELYYLRAEDSIAWEERSRRAYLSGLEINFKELSRGRIQVEV